MAERRTGKAEYVLRSAMYFDEGLKGRSGRRRGQPVDVLTGEGAGRADGADRRKWKSTGRRGFRAVSGVGARGLRRGGGECAGGAGAGVGRAGRR